MGIGLREFQTQDVPLKVKWINDPENNKYLHYDLPLKESKTYEWLASVKHSNHREDLVITLDGNPVGIIGLLNIDYKNKKAEFYICLAEEKGKGIANIATKLLLKEYAHKKHSLIKVYLHTEVNNIGAQNLFEKAGFEKEGRLKNDIIHQGNVIDRYIYGIDVNEFFQAHGE